ncbi:hypothetical protein PAXRUDRAFT_221142 [Paxillus rubicundulus Ve08.2h10]|uniref:Uncharacterized protein n=1 Tax=Paxillus rubicundulus Ve08.2h10 TaxID=930991 RepID=A0A0D0DTW2_9AGAM|nr:hypothetical protein PAXRUDRAFT_221142 [Paxillus rubicundulus Ve08.2h10]
MMPSRTSATPPIPHQSQQGRSESALRQPVGKSLAPLVLHLATCSKMVPLSCTTSTLVGRPQAAHSRNRQPTRTSPASGRLTRCRLLGHSGDDKRQTRTREGVTAGLGAEQAFKLLWPSVPFSRLTCYCSLSRVSSRWIHGFIVPVGSISNKCTRYSN